MKTRKKRSRAGKIAAMAFVILTAGVAVLAQPKSNEFESLEFEQAFERLEFLMVSAERAARYEAPSVMDDEIMSAYHRLDLLAERTEIELKYEAPGMERILSEELANEKEMELNTKPDDFLTFILQLKKRSK